MNKIIRNLILSAVFFNCIFQAHIQAGFSMQRESLHEAAARGDLERVDWLIKKGADPNASDVHRTSPLRYAVIHGHAAVVARLLAAGAVADTRYSYCSCSGCSDRGDYDAAVERLVSAGIEPYIINYGSTFPSLSATERLIAAGADLDRVPTPLSSAVQLGKDEFIKLFIAAGADVEKNDHSDNNALMRAIYADHDTAAAQLIAAGADVETTSEPYSDGRRPLHHAATGNMVHRLVSAGANIMSTTKRSGLTPFHYFACDPFTVGFLQRKIAGKALALLGVHPIDGWERCSEVKDKNGIILGKASSKDVLFALLRGTNPAIVPDWSIGEETLEVCDGSRWSANKIRKALCAQRGDGKTALESVRLENPYQPLVAILERAEEFVRERPKFKKPRVEEID